MALPLMKLALNWQITIHERCSVAFDRARMVANHIGKLGQRKMNETNDMT